MGLIVSALAEMRPEGSENPSETSETEAARLLQLAASPYPPGDSVKAAIGRAAVRSGISPGRAKSLWYREAKRIDASELDTLREIERGRKERMRAATTEHLRHIEQLAALRARLATRDPDFHRPDIEALDFIQTFLAHLPPTE